MAPTETAIARSAPVSLFELEDDLQALLNSEGDITPEQEEEYTRDLAVALEKTVQKRDRVAQYIRHCESQGELGRAEARRLTERARLFENAATRIRGYVVSIIEALGEDAKGKMRKLEGQTATLSVRANPASVLITDEEAVPLTYKSVTVTMSGIEYEALKARLELDDGLNFGKLPAVRSIDKAAVKAAIAAKIDVPGADLIVGGMSLVVK